MPMNYQGNIGRWHFVRLSLCAMAVVCLLVLSCAKSSSDTPVQAWEDDGADSARLNILLQTPQGLILMGQYISLGLSSDSLSKSLLVRKTASGAGGVAVFRKLYPRKIFYNCIAVTNGQTFYGSGNVRLNASSTKDTTLIVH
jgi:hypothetical protein